MSVPNGGDDDIEDKLEQLVNEISELTDLLRFAMSPPDEQSEVGDEETVVDLWDEGTSKRVNTVGEFKDWRRRAAVSDEVSSPFFSSGTFDMTAGRINAEVELFMDGYRNLQELYARLSDEDFDAFLREYLKETTRPDGPGEPAVVPELLDIQEPSKEFYGVFEIGGEVEVQDPFTPFDFVEVYGHYWHPEAELTTVLGLEPVAEVSVVKGQKTTEEINKDLAKAIYTTRGKELPDRYMNLLPPGMAE